MGGLTPSAQLFFAFGFCLFGVAAIVWAGSKYARRKE